jgi:murein DD-endopeptidase MepM/ murein hydrolase activator NlpD
MAMSALVREVLARDTGRDLAATLADAAARHAFPPRWLVALFLAESNLHQRAERWAYWDGRQYVNLTARAQRAIAANDRAGVQAVLDELASRDLSFGLGQQTVVYAPIGDRTHRLDNVLAVRAAFLDDVDLAVDVAARQLGRYYQLYQQVDPLEPLCRYNWPSLVGAQNPNRGTYARAWADSLAFVTRPARAGYQFPVRGAVSYHDRHWDGLKAVDIFAPAGADLVAIADGTAEVADFRDGGHTVMLYTDDGHVAYYGHLVQGTGRAGRVRAGEVIGQVDNTGNARNTPSHCHWAWATRAYGIDNNGAGDLAPWPLLRQLEGVAPAEEDPEMIAELQREIDRLNAELIRERSWGSAIQAHVIRASREELEAAVARREREDIIRALHPIIERLRQHEV